MQTLTKRLSEVGDDGMIEAKSMADLFCCWSPVCPVSISLLTPACYHRLLATSQLLLPHAQLADLHRTSHGG